MVEGSDGLLKRLIGVDKRFGIHVCIGNGGSSHITEDSVGIATCWTGYVKEGLLLARFRLGGLEGVEVRASDFERLIHKARGEVSGVGCYGKITGRPIHSIPITVDAITPREGPS
jgi:hypothetical protein